MSNIVNGYIIGCDFMKFDEFKIDGDIATCYSDPSKALKELGWKAERGLDEMCEDSWRWQSQNPNGYPD